MRNFVLRMHLTRGLVGVGWEMHWRSGHACASDEISPSRERVALPLAPCSCSRPPLPARTYVECSCWGAAAAAAAAAGLLLLLLLLLLTTAALPCAGASLTDGSLPPAQLACAACRPGSARRCRLPLCLLATAALPSAGASPLARLCTDTACVPVPACGGVARWLTVRVPDLVVPHRVVSAVVVAPRRRLPRCRQRQARKRISCRPPARRPAAPCFKP